MLNGDDRREGRPGREDGHGPEILAVALQALGAGIGRFDRRGRMVSADARFLDLHGLPTSALDGAEETARRPWPNVLETASCDLPGGDSAAIAAACAAAIEAASRGAEARQTLRLTGGGVRRINGVNAADGTVVLVVADGPAEPGPVDGGRPAAERRLVHDINNVLGGILANLFLVLSDVEANHPARARLEALNRAAIELRGMVRGAVAGATASVPDA